MLQEEHTYSILFVDDEIGNLNVFKTTYKWYYNVFVAESAKQGLQVLKQESIDMIITDQRMPDMTGVEFLKAAIDEFPDIVRIIITAYTDVEAIAYAINEASIYQYIQKPWDADEMRHILRKAFVSYQLQLDNKKLITDLENANKSLVAANENLEAKVMARTAEVMAQKSEIELKNSKITASINYAQRIQSATLPDIENMQRAFGELFVLFKPRDIVSGDFYWFHENENYKIITAVDCTGHGVPGAFMSLVGQQALNKIIIQNQIMRPDLILNELHKEIRSLLKQHNSDNQDGMDMTLCCLNKKTRNMEFAGAKNPLIYISNGEVVQVKGDKHPIGGKQKELERIFTNHTIKINQPTCFYLFSDGFQDQFGGSEGRKFMIKKLRELLLKVHRKSLDMQHDILSEAFENWKGKNKQLDDVLLMGFRMG